MLLHRVMFFYWILKHRKFQNHNPSIDLAFILEVALQLFPVDEFKLLSEINELFIIDYNEVRNK